MTDRLTDLGYAAGWRVVRALPEPAAAALFRRAADVAMRRQGPGVRQLSRNLRRVVGGEPDEQLVRDALRSYARYWMEAFRLPSWSRQRILDTVAINGELLAEPLGRGQGVVVALPHMANWDHAGAWVAANGWPLSTVAERLRPESVFQRFLAYRRSLGMEIIPLTGGEGPPLDILADRLRAGALVPLLADRDLSARGVPVTFFGEPTRMPPGPALLAVRTGVPLLAASLWYEPGRTHVRLRPVAVPESGILAQRVAGATQRIADVMAEGIAEHPADWHMLQRLWLADLPGRAGRARAGAGGGAGSDGGGAAVPRAGSDGGGAGVPRAGS
ncbi:MAG: phosphatidylinositol mannoside acyltransferase [Micromonosporaceae bacterium]